jgi:hypothetical protein
VTVPSGAPGAADQHAQAVQFNDCLTAAGLPAELTEVWGGFASVDWKRTEGVVLLYSWPDGRAGATEDMSSEAATEFLTTYSDQPRLMLDGTDRSPEVVACWESSGYEPPPSLTDPDVELETKRAIVEASNEWADCARANGFPQVVDAPEPVADAFTSMPTVTLPATIEATQLKALLAACPNFLPDHATVTEQGGGLPSLIDPGGQPNVTIDPVAMGADQADWGRFYELMAILGQARIDFYAEHGQETPP